MRVQVIWDIMRCWVKQHPVRITDESSYHARILAQEPTLQANFGGSGQISKFKGAGKARFVQNPENWGPRPKHGRPMLPHESKAAAEAASTGMDAAAATESPVQAQAPADSAPAAAAEVAAATPAPASDTDVAAGACAQQDTSTGVMGGAMASKDATAAKARSSKTLLRTFRLTRQLWQQRLGMRQRLLKSNQEISLPVPLR